MNYPNENYTELGKWEINTDRIAEAMIKMEEEFQAAEDKSEFTKEGFSDENL